MTRDMDMVRTISSKLEERASGDRAVELDFAGRDGKAVRYHLLLVHEGGLIEAEKVSNRGGAEALPLRSTWEGREFPDAARNSRVWEKAKTTLLEKVGGLPFDVFKALLIHSARQAVGLP